MIVDLSEKQVWFILCAIEAKENILPLNEKSLSHNIFKHDYGFTKKEIEAEISDLRKKLKP